MPSEEEIGEIGLSNIDGYLNFKRNDEKNDEKSFAAFAFLEDSDPTLFEVFPVEHAFKEATTLAGFQFLI